MKSLLTPKRRQPTRNARRTIDAMVATWRRRTGAWSQNTMIGLSIRAGMLERHLARLVMETDAIPSGKVRVPAEVFTGPLHANMHGFDVNLDDLWEDLNVRPGLRRDKPKDQ